MLDKIVEWFPEDELLVADGFDDAIIGVDSNSVRLIYSVSKCIEILSKDMDEVEAVEYFDFNVRKATIFTRGLDLRVATQFIRLKYLYQSPTVCHPPAKNLRKHIKNIPKQAKF